MKSYYNNELDDYIRVRRPVYEDMLIALDYQTQEIESLKQLIEHYEEEHTTTFKLWQDTIKSVELLKANGLPDDTQFVLMTKEDYERNKERLG